MSEWNGGLQIYVWWFFVFFFGVAGGVMRAALYNILQFSEQDSLDRSGMTRPLRLAPLYTPKAPPPPTRGLRLHKMAATPLRQPF